MQIYFISNLMQLQSQYSKVLVHVNLFKVVEEMPSYLDTVMLFHCFFFSFFKLSCKSSLWQTLF